MTTQRTTRQRTPSLNRFRGTACRYVWFWTPTSGSTGWCSTIRASHPSRRRSDQDKRKFPSMRPASRNSYGFWLIRCRKRPSMPHCKPHACRSRGDQRQRRGAEAEGGGGMGGAGLPRPKRPEVSRVRARLPRGFPHQDLPRPRKTTRPSHRTPQQRTRQARLKPGAGQGGGARRRAATGKRIKPGRSDTRKAASVSRERSPRCTSSRFHFSGIKNFIDTLGERHRLDLGDVLLHARS